MSAWIAVVAVGLGSYLLRISMLVLASRVGLPVVIERAARYAVPVSFAALAASSLAGHMTHLHGALAPAASVIVAVVAVRRTGSPRAALLAGMPTLWLLSALLHG
jgi:branched-subunit amino acid transport protein